MGNTILFSSLGRHRSTTTSCIVRKKSDGVFPLREYVLQEEISSHSLKKYIMSAACAEGR
jgi:hypothetical protein